MTLNKVKTVTIAPTNETVMKHSFGPIKYGGKYKIAISTDVENAIASQPVIYMAPPILPPHQLNVLHEEGNYIIYWQERSLPDNVKRDLKYNYEVLVSEGTKSVESAAQVFRTHQPPYIFKNAKPSVIYSFAVRLVTEEGYQSLLSETVSVTSPQSKFILYNF